jgi:hypothetical protein
MLHPYPFLFHLLFAWLFKVSTRSSRDIVCGVVKTRRMSDKAQKLRPLGKSDF